MCKSHSLEASKLIGAAPSPSRNISRRQRTPGSPRKAARNVPVDACMAPLPKHSTRGSDKPFPVWIHIYDLGPVSRYLINSWALNSRDNNCLGMFHVGIEVLGVEFSFRGLADCGKDDSKTGLTWHNPKSHPRHVYRESACLGNSAFDPKQVCALLKKLEEDWPARMYNVLTKNCVHFAEHLATCLGAPVLFPEWTHGLAKNLASIDLVLPEAAASFLPGSWGMCSKSQPAPSASGGSERCRSDQATRWSKSEQPPEIDAI